MADLKINVIVDDNGAAQKLHEVEAAVKGVESASAAATTSAVKAASAAEGMAKVGWGNIATQVGNIASAFSGLQGALAGLGLSAAIDNFLKVTGRLSDLSAKTAITVRELQRLDYAGGLVGVSLERITTAISMFQNRLAGGDKSALSAVRQLSIDLDGLRRMDPGAQFELIASRLSQIVDPAERAHIAMELFGRSGTQLLPLLVSDIRAVGDEAERLGAVMSDKVVAGGDKLGDALSKLGHIATSFIGTALEPLLNHILKFDTELQRWDRWKQALRIDDVLEGWRTFISYLGIVRNGIGPAPATPGAPGMFKARGPEAPMTLEEALALQVPVVRAGTVAGSSAVRDNPFTGNKLLADAKQALQDLRDVGGLTKLTADETRKLNDLLGDALLKYSALGRTAPKAMVDTWLATMKTVSVTSGLTTMPGTNVGVPFTPAMLPFIGVTNGLNGLNLPGGFNPAQMPEVFASGARNATRATTDWRSSLDDLSRAFSQLAQVGGGSLSGITQEIAQLINAMNLGAQAGSQMRALFQGPNGGFSAARFTPGGAGGWQNMFANYSSLASTAISGYAAMQQATATGSTGSRTLKGMATGGQIGTSIMPGWGTVIGMGVGALVGFLRGKLSTAGRSQIVDFAQQHGGFNNLHEELRTQLGEDEGEAMWRRLTQTVGRSDKEGAQQAVTDAQNALTQAPQRRAEGIQTMIGGVNARASVFGEQMAGVKPGQQTAGQAEDFARIGTMGYGALLAQVKESGGLYSALQQLGPTLEALAKAQHDFGFETTGAAGALLHLRNTVEQNKPQFQSLEADAAVLNGAVASGLNNVALFQATASDISQQINAIVANGVPLNEAMAMSQPTLQALWEAQQKYHFEVDASTQAILNQAQEQGVVGPQMQNVNQQILNVLVAIGRVLGADIPAAMGNLPNAAQNAANGMNAAFSTVKPPSISDVVPDDLIARGKMPPRNPDAYPDETPEPQYHGGGYIWKRLHRGGLSSDEVPIIAQRGEFMISRRGVAANGLGLLRRINSGERVGGGNTSIHVSISALDGADVERVVQSAAFGAAIERAALKNTNGIGTTIRRAAR